MILISEGSKRSEGSVEWGTVRGGGPHATRGQASMEMSNRIQAQPVHKYESCARGHSSNCEDEAPKMNFGGQPN